MRRVALICALALPLFGLTRPVHPGARIGVLRMPPDVYNSEPSKTIATNIQNDLRIELASRGFGSFDAAVTFNDLQRGGAAPADYYVEIGCSFGSRTSGMAAAAVGPIMINSEIAASDVDAEVRLFNGRTLELVARYELRRKRRSVIPAGVGIGTYGLWAMLPLPLVRDAQFRALEREIAREAADRIAHP
jgi:hypothetical protein